MRRLPLLLLVLVLLRPAALAAHDFWILPAAFSVPAEEAAASPLPVELRVGDQPPGDPLPRSEVRVVRFEALGAEGAVTATGVEGSSPAGALPALAPGPYTIVYESTPALSVLDAKAFSAYLMEEGLEEIWHERARRGDSDAPGRELYSRSVKSLITVGQPPLAESAETAGDDPHTLATGLPFELIPEQSPATLAQGDQLTVVVRRGRYSLVGTLVEARPLDGGPTQAVRSDSRGRATFRLDRAGTWLLTAVTMVPTTPTPSEQEPAAEQPADWRSFWTSLTFEVPAALSEAAALAPNEP